MVGELSVTIFYKFIALIAVAVIGTNVNHYYFSGDKENENSIKQTQIDSQQNRSR